MSVLLQIKADRIAAMKARDSHKSSFLGHVVAQISIVGKDGLRAEEKTDAEMISNLKKLLTQNQDAAKIANTEELEKERLILESYLPTQLTELELFVAINRFMAQNSLEFSIKSMKPLMEILNAEFPGQVNSAQVAQILKS